MAKLRKTVSNPTNASGAKAATTITGKVASRKQNPVAPLKKKSGHVKLGAPDRKASELDLTSFFSRLSSPLGLPPNLTHEQWDAIGSKLLRAHDKSLINWQIGEWLSYGGGEWGQTYIDATKKTGKPYQLFADYKWVWGVFEFSYRNENLSWTHHRTVASLPPERRQELLKQAEEYDWSVTELKTHINPTDTEDEPDDGKSQSEGGDTSQSDENRAVRFPDSSAVIKGESRPKNDDTDSKGPLEREEDRGSRLTPEEGHEIEEDRSDADEPAQEMSEADWKQFRERTAKHAFDSFYHDVNMISDDDQITIKEISDYAWEQRADPQVRQQLATIVGQTQKVEEFLEEMTLLDERLRRNLLRLTSTANDEHA